MVDIDAYTNLYFSNGTDAPYELKKGGILNIKPILLKDYAIYDDCIQLLQIKKNEIGIAEIIQMSYLDFLISFVFKQYTIAEEKIKILLSLCLKDAKYVSFEKDKGKYCIAICDENGIIQKIINHKEFDDISKIILNQNDANYDNRYVTPEVREMMQEYYKVKYKDIEAPSLEKRKAFVCSKIGKTYKEVSEMTYREFDMIYKSAVDSEIYLATKITEASYKYEVKNPTSHPLFEKAKDPYEEVFEDTNVLASKGISGANQLAMANLNNDI